MEERNKKDSAPSDFIKEEILLREHFVKYDNVPDVEDELKRFHVKKQWISTRMLVIGSAIAATMLLVAFAYLYLLRTDRSLSASDYLVYEERSTVDDVLLRSGNKEAINIEEATSSHILNGKNNPILIEGGLSYQTMSRQAVVQEEVLTVPNGKMVKIILEDGSEAWINARSKITFPNRFVGNERKIQLEGEAFFKVVKDKNRPFVVETEGLSTQVLGTEFNVKSANADEAQVTLLSGKVRVSADKVQFTKVLTPGEEFDRDVKGTIKINKIDLDTYYRWYEGYFYFDQVSLGEVLREVGRWYNKDVVFENPSVDRVKIRFTAERKESLGTIIELMNDFKLAKIVIRDNRIIVQR
ncbi:MAG: FecR domain-containing protein [Sphingobacterium sp.]|jgi:hypothetical protein|nr:FecR domain-containing protein [Sphingobacterium sp.]